jgi:hypothetical protein
MEMSTRSEEIVDNPNGWVAKDIREYVASDGRRGQAGNTLLLLLLLVTRGRRSAAALVTGQGIIVDGGLA